MNIRKAREEDMEALIRMRWEFTLEHQPEQKGNYECYVSIRLHD